MMHTVIQKGLLFTIVDTSIKLSTLHCESKNPKDTRLLPVT